jgi:multisubunit Na+/H+ antiporter MnhF subunit
MDLPSWSLGLSLIVLTIAIHTTVVVLMAFSLEARIRVRVGTNTPERLRAIPTVIAHIGAIAVLLAALHGLEGVLWALAYWGLGALDSFTDASVYSLATMTTSEIPGLTLPARWRMLSALEAVNGALLFGISTAFLFAVIQVHWQSVHRRPNPGSVN